MTFDYEPRGIWIRTMLADDVDLTNIQFWFN
jgi:hypothetical protein